MEDYFGFITNLICTAIAVLAFFGIDNVKTLKPTKAGKLPNTQKAGTVARWSHSKREWLLLGVVLIALLSSGYSTYQLRQSSTQTAVVNLHENVQKWVYALGHSVQPLDSSTSIFVIMVTLSDQTKIVIHQPSKSDRYLIFQAKIEIKDDLLKSLQSLPKDQIAHVFQRVRLDLSMAKMSGYEIDIANASVLVIERVPITASLTEAVFLDAFDEIESDVRIANDSFVVALHLALEQKATASPPA